MRISSGEASAVCLVNWVLHEESSKLRHMAGAGLPSQRRRVVSGGGILTPIRLYVAAERTTHSEAGAFDRDFGQTADLRSDQQTHLIVEPGDLVILQMRCSVR